MRSIATLLRRLTGWEWALYASFLLIPALGHGLTWLGLSGSAALGLAIVPFAILLFLITALSFVWPLDDED